MKNKEAVFKIMTIVFLIDQGIKVTVCQKMIENQLLPIIPNFFSLYYVKNTGAAFSILKNNTSFIIILSCIILSILDWYIKQGKDFSKMERIALGLIIGGIFGNLLDRVLYHAVIDYLSFQFGKYSFPVFNLADIAITVGVFLMILDLFMDKKKEEKKDPIIEVKLIEKKPKKKTKKENTK